MKLISTTAPVLMYWCTDDCRKILLCSKWTDLKLWTSCVQWWICLSLEVSTRYSEWSLMSACHFFAIDANSWSDQWEPEDLPAVEVDSRCQPADRAVHGGPGPRLAGWPGSRPDRGNDHPVRIRCIQGEYQRLLCDIYNYYIFIIIIIDYNDICVSLEQLKQHLQTDSWKSLLHQFRFLL